MRKAFVILGIVLIVSGLIVFSFQNLTRQEEKQDFTRALNEWDISRDAFKAGENLTVGFIPGYNWGWPPQDNTEIDGVAFPRAKVYFIKVTDTTTNNYTEFSVVLIIGPPPYYPDDIRVHPKIHVIHHGGLDVEEYPLEIGGTVKHDGTYNVTTELYPDFIQNVLPDNKTEIIPPVPPSELRLYQVIVEQVYPFKLFLVLGPLIVGTGVVALVLGVWKGNRARARAHRTTLNTQAKNQKQ